MQSAIQDSLISTEINFEARFYTKIYYSDMMRLKIMQNFGLIEYMIGYATRGTRLLKIHTKFQGNFDRFR
jgi:hypothetical protein